MRYCIIALSSGHPNTTHSESSAETESLVDSLNGILRHLTSLTQTSTPSSPGRLSLASASRRSIPNSDTASIATKVSHVSFRSVLRKTRPYRNSGVLNASGASTRSSGSSASVFSLPYTELGVSHEPLSEQQSMALIKLPVEKRSLYNHRRYGHYYPWAGGMNTQSNMRVLPQIMDTLEYFQSIKVCSTPPAPLFPQPTRSCLTPHFTNRSSLVMKPPTSLVTVSVK